MGFYSVPCQRHRVVIFQRVPIGDPVSDYFSGLICFHALYDLEHIFAAHLAGCQSVRTPRAAHLVRFDQAQLQSIRPVRAFSVLDCGKSVTVHQKTGERQCLHPPEIVHAACIASRAVCPEIKFPGDLRLQLVCLFFGQMQIICIDLRRWHKTRPHYVGAQSLQCASRQRDTHVSIPAPLAQGIKVVLDVLF